MVNVLRYLVLALFLLPLASCEKTPGYGEAIRFVENDTEWSVTLHRAWYHADPARVMVELEYRNDGGDSYSIKPTNLVVTDGEQRWFAGGKAAYIPHIRPGESFRIRAAFNTVTVTGSQLYLQPFNDLVHANPRFLLKNKGEVPLPGEHLTPDWHIPR